MLSSLLLKTISCNCVRWNSNRASIGRINRTIYTRLYPVTVVRPDGSSFRIRFKEPRRIITLPVDIESLSPEERQRHLLKRKPKQVLQVVEDFEDDFDIERGSTDRSTRHK